MVAHFSVGIVVDKDAPDHIQHMATDINAAVTDVHRSINDLSTTVTNLSTTVSNLPIFTPPQGRLTLASGTPVMTSTQSAKTTVYYTPYVGQFVPLYNGTTWSMVDVGGELSQATTDTTKSPAAVVPNSNYDLFVWPDVGTSRCTRGPAWSSDTVRGTGAGTTELVRQNGIWLNKNAITNGPAASRGTYVGTVRSNGSSQIDFILGAGAAGGLAAFIGVWNCYNRVDLANTVIDSTSSWVYNTGTWRPANNSTNNRISFVLGLQEDSLDAFVQSSVANTTVVGNQVGIGLNSTTAPSTVFTQQSAVAGWQTINTRYSFYALGFNYIQNLELGGGSGTNTWIGALLLLNVRC